MRVVVYLLLKAMALNGMAFIFVVWTLEVPREYFGVVARFAAWSLPWAFMAMAGQWAADSLATRGKVR
jgi:hypothetical protein